MKKGFVPTENFRRLREAEKLVARRGAREAGLVIVMGKFGIGKSELTARWASDSNYVFVRAKSTWTKRGLLDQLAEAMGLPTNGRALDVQSRIIAKMAVDMVPLIIDEADFLVTRDSAALLEVLRDITDLTGTMCFLVAMDRFVSKLTRYGHIMSRVARVVHLQPLSVDDVRATVAAKAEVAMDAQVVEMIHQQSDGRMRLVLNAIANIEQWARANSWQQVTPELLRGRTLCAELDSRSAMTRGAA